MYEIMKLKNLYFSDEIQWIMYCLLLILLTYRMSINSIMENLIWKNVSTAETNIANKENTYASSNEIQLARFKPACFTILCGNCHSTNME